MCFTDKWLNIPFSSSNSVILKKIRPSLFLNVRARDLCAWRGPELPRLPQALPGEREPSPGWGRSSLASQQDTRKPKALGREAARVERDCTVSVWHACLRRDRQSRLKSIIQQRCTSQRGSLPRPQGRYPNSLITLSAGKQAFISKLNFFDCGFCPSGPVWKRLTLG